MTIEELEQIAKSVHQENEKYDFEINVCMDLACASQGADKLRAAIVKAAEGSEKKFSSVRPGAWDHAPLALWFVWNPKKFSITT